MRHDPKAASFGVPREPLPTVVSSARLGQRPIATLARISQITCVQSLMPTLAQEPPADCSGPGESPATEAPIEVAIGALRRRRGSCCEELITRRPADVH